MTTLKRLMRQHTRRECLRILNEVHPPDASFPIDEATDLLEKFLAQPQQIKHVKKHMREHGISQTTFYRAARELRVKRKVTGFGKNKRSWWSL